MGAHCSPFLHCKRKERRLEILRAFSRAGHPIGLSMDLPLAFRLNTKFLETTCWCLGLPDHLQANLGLELEELGHLRESNSTV